MNYNSEQNNFNFNQNGGAENVTITLYKASWCGHCTRMIPEWKKLEKVAENIPTLTVKTFDSDKNPEEIAKRGQMTARGKISFPTIIITRETDEEYDGQRTAEAMLEKLGFPQEAMKCKLQKGGNGTDNIPPQCGGAREKDNQYYKMKYLKYKAKYMLARSRLEN